MCANLNILRDNAILKVSQSNTYFNKNVLLFLTVYALLWVVDSYCKKVLVLINLPE